MRVALVNTLYAPYQVGGAERAAQRLAEGLASRGHAVCVITLGEPDLDARSVINGVTVHRLPLANFYWPYSGAPGNPAARAAWRMRDFHNARMSARAARVLDLERPDVLHTHGLAGFSVAVWNAAARRRLPIVHTLHDYYLMCPPGVMYRKKGNCRGICPRCMPFAAYRRRASRAVHAAVGVSQFILDRHVRAGFFRRSAALTVISNGVSIAPRKAPRRTGAPLVFGFIGRLSPEKGIGWLLEAFTASASPGSRLVVAGKGERGFVESLKAGVSSPSVQFLGHVDAAWLYEQVDVVVVPSLWNEPFGRSALEPLAYGIPVIATNRGGLPDIVRDGVTGIIVDPSDAGSLARAISRLSAAPDFVENLGRNSAAELSRFSEEGVVEAYARLYADVAPHSTGRSVPLNALRV